MPIYGVYCVPRTLWHAAAVLTAGGSLSALASGPQQLIAVLAATSALSGSFAGSQQVTAVLAAASAVATTAHGSQQATTVLAAASSFGATAGGPIAAAAVLAADSSFTATLIGPQQVTTVLAAASSLIAKSSGAPQQLSTVLAADSSIAALGFSVAFTATLNSNGTFLNPESVRNIIAPLSSGGSRVRVKFTGGSSSLVINNASIGVQSTTYNTVATPVELLFGGSSGFNIGAGVSTTSDWVSLTVAKTDTVVVIADGTTAGSEKFTGTGVASCVFWSNGSGAPTASYNQASPAGSWVNNGALSMIAEIDVIEHEMPTENARKRARKLVLLPSGDQMYVPVITEIDFIDLVGDPSAKAVRWAVGQEFDFTVDNTAKSGRKVHVDELDPIDVNPDGTPTDPNNPPTPGTDTSQQLAVERIDTWPVVDLVERGQEFDFAPDNKTGSDKQPPSFTTHEKTHIYRYYKDPNNPDDSGIWIDSELIDKWSFIDTVNRGQESGFTLNNQTNADFQGGDLSGQADPDDPDITIGGGSEGDGTSGEGTVDIPVRLDPFQNLVNFNPGGGPFVIATVPTFELGKATYYVSKDGFNWTQFSRAFAVDGATFDDSEPVAVAGSQKNFYIAGFGRGFFPNGSSAALVKVSTDGGVSWSDNTPDALTTGGTIGDTAYFDAHPSGSPVGQKAFRLLTLGGPSASNNYWSSYDNLQTWTNEGHTLPSFWGKQPRADMTKGTSSAGQKVFIYSFDDSIFLAVDDGGGIPPNTNFPAFPPSLWLKVYDTPPGDDNTSYGIQSFGGQLGRIGSLTGSSIAQPSTDTHGNAQSGTTFLATGNVKTQNDTTFSWVNIGPIRPLIVQQSLPPTGSLVWVLTNGQGGTLAVYTSGGPISNLDPLPPSGVPTGEGFRLVRTGPDPGPFPDFTIFDTPAEVWITQVASSGVDVQLPLVFVSVGGYNWQMITLTPSDPTDNSGAVRCASGDTRTMVLVSRT